MTERHDGANPYHLAPVGRPRTAGEDEFRRYIPTMFTFDTRYHLLDDVDPSWDSTIQEQHDNNRESVVREIAFEHGPENLDQKVRNVRDLGRAPWSVVAGHSLHMHQVRGAFIATHYYPALLGACALGERILNQLVATLKSDYADHPATAKIIKKQTIDKWHLAITTLHEWGVLDDIGDADFRKLEKLRHRAVHYSAELDVSDARTEALAAITTLRDIVERLFQPFGESELFFTGPVGRAYIRRDAESVPLVRHFFLPACALVSPELQFRPTPEGTLDIYDVREWTGPQSLTDVEFSTWRSLP